MDYWIYYSNCINTDEFFFLMLPVHALRTEHFPDMSQHTSTWRSFHPCGWPSWSSVAVPRISKGTPKCPLEHHTTHLFHHIESVSTTFPHQLITRMPLTHRLCYTSSHTHILTTSTDYLLDPLGTMLYVPRMQRKCFCVMRFMLNGSFTR